MKQCPFLFISLFSCICFGQVYQPIEQPLGVTERVVIRGYRGKLQIVSNSADTLKVETQKMDSGSQFNQWKIELEQNGTTTQILVKGPSEQEDWNHLRTGSQLPQFHMKVSMPPKPVEVFWAEGEILVDQWNANLSLQMNKGTIQIQKGQGMVKAQLLEGDLQILQRKGSVEAQIFKGQMTAKGIEGSLRLDNFGALCRISDHKGPIDIHNHSGKLNLDNIEGGTSFENVSGAISLSQLAGSLEGNFVKGSLTAHLSSLQNINITSQDAAISIDAPKDSGAQVRLRSEKGDIWGPSFLHKSRKGLWVERKGRLKGKQQGSIKIVSKYGNIVLK